MVAEIGPGMASLLERLTADEAAARQQLADLREQVAALEERLSELSIARKVIEPLPAEESAAQDANESRPDQNRRPGPPQSTAHRGRASSDRRDLAGADEQVVAAMTSEGRPMRAKEVAQALGEPQARGRVEATRAGERDDGHAALVGRDPHAALTDLNRTTAITLLPLDVHLPALRAGYGPVYDQVHVPAQAYQESANCARSASPTACWRRLSLPDDVAASVARVLVGHAVDLVPAPAVGTQFLEVRTLIGTGKVARCTPGPRRPTAPFTGRSTAPSEDGCA